VSLPPERRQALLQAKLAAVVRDRWGSSEGTGGTFPEGATLLGSDGSTGYVLTGEGSSRSLGMALAWAVRKGVTDLHLVVEADSSTVAVLARRAGTFAVAVTVWRLCGRDVLASAPAPPSTSPPLPAEAAAFAGVMRAHGADPVVEYGILTGEVLGLEVARVIVDESGAHLEVGVGHHDREAQYLLRPDWPPEAALDDAVAAVRRWRRAGAPRHLANTLAGERWLRVAVTAHPDIVGAAYLAPVPPPLPRGDLRQPAPAPAAGVDADDRPMLVVCSTGIDLDLVPAAADARLADGRAGVRLVLAVPPADDYPITRDLAAALREPAEIVTVPADWRALAS